MNNNPQINEEIWIPIHEFENYQISTLGRVCRTSDGKMIKPVMVYHKNRFKQVQVTLCNPKPKNFAVGRLVAQAFLPNPFDQIAIRRIDHDLRNNTLANLEWTGTNGIDTASELSKRKEALKKTAESSKS